LNKSEAMQFSWQPIPQIREALAARPEAYTTWFRIAMERVF
jgi:hypothetical protein